MAYARDIETVLLRSRNEESYWDNFQKDVLRNVFLAILFRGKKFIKFLKFFFGLQSTSYNLKNKKKFTIRRYYNTENPMNAIFSPSMLLVHKYIT